MKEEPLVLIKQGPHLRPILGKLIKNGKIVSRKLFPGFFSFTISH
jgi:hypothetical protein